MSKMCTYLSFFFFLALCVGTLDTSHSQEGVSVLPSIRASAVHLVNKANQSVHYSLRPSGGVWSNYTLDSGESTTISCNGCVTDWFEILIRTGENQVQYDLEATKRFSIGWNDRRRLWDVYRVD
jgi:hypothetical protein